MEIRVHNSILFYEKIGSGKESLLMFHGFGQDNNVFHSLAAGLSRKYTCYLFDLYFHGKSTWGHDEKPLSKKQWAEIISVFLEEQQIAKFSILGFSIGGKLALATAEAFPEKVLRLYLIAPDGVKTNNWYRLAVSPFGFRQLFKSMIERPERFLSIVKKLQQLKIVDAGLLRFAEYQMTSTEKRRRVYYSWLVFRKLNFSLPHVAAVLNTNGVKTIFIVGKHDKVIPLSPIEKFQRRLKHSRLEILDMGHHGLINRAEEIILSD